MKFSTKTHEWLIQDHDTGTVGITQHAQEELGDIVYVELPKVGKRVIAGGEVAVLESTKAAVDVYSPVTGEILEVNNTLDSDPGLINRSPEDSGWIFRIRIEDPNELRTLAVIADK